MLCKDDGKEYFLKVFRYLWAGNAWAHKSSVTINLDSLGGVSLLECNSLWECKSSFPKWQTWLTFISIDVERCCSGGYTGSNNKKIIKKSDGNTLGTYMCGTWRERMKRKTKIKHQVCSQRRWLYIILPIEWGWAEEFLHVLLVLKLLHCSQTLAYKHFFLLHLLVFQAH